MKLEIRTPIWRNKWLASLGVKGEADRQLLADMESAEGLLMEAAEPRGIYRIMERKDIRLPGLSIERHLEGCRKVAVMGVTLGMEIDNLIRRTQITDMARAVLLDSGASLLAEQACDRLEELIETYIKTDSKEQGEIFTTSRFSPGYGDFPIEMQREFIRCIDGQRKIGLNVTRDSLMIPRKSITAIIGLADHPVSGHPATCEECVLRATCSLREKGEFCGN
ncbi:MAG: vitamin B12 dependent-methionine synthase activation domain-containing protein [Bacillota bacterium]|nr:vitamin B12 dependent-methionine synthase activation domain-containing protein [Bacillota bacterium]